MPTYFYIAWRYLLSDLKQSLLITLAVGLGIAIIVFIPSVNTSFYNELLKKTLDSSPHITVLKQEKSLQPGYNLLEAKVNTPDLVVLKDTTSSQQLDTLRNFRPLQNQLEQLPSVIGVSPQVTEQVVVVKGAQRMAASLQGLDPEKEPSVTDIETKIKVGRLKDLSGDNAILGWRLADELGVRLGQRFQVVTATGQRRFRLVGLTDSGLYFTDRKTLLVSLTTAQALLKQPGQVSSIGLRLEDLEEAPELARQIAANLQVKTRHWIEENEEILKQMTSFRVMVSFINFLIIASAASSITSMLIMTVANKSKEIGILKAMGMRPSQIARIFVSQALLLCVLGIVFGVLGGQFFIELYNLTPIAKQSVMGIERKPVTMNLEFALLACFYAFITSVVASLIPAWQASRLDPVKAINQ